MQVLTEFPADDGFSTILRADVLCPLRIVVDGDIITVVGRTIPAWLAGSLSGVVALVAIIASSGSSFGSLLQVAVIMTLPVALAGVWLVVSYINRFVSESPFLTYDRRTKKIHLRFEDVTIKGDDVAALHILKGWYRFKDCWKAALVSELSIVVRDRAAYLRYHAISGNGVDIGRIANALGREFSVDVIRGRNPQAEQPSEHQDEP